MIKHGVQFEEKTSDDQLKDEWAQMLNVDEDQNAVHWCLEKWEICIILIH